MQRRALLVAACALFTCAAAPALTPEQQRGLDIARQVERVAHERTLWPGYDPLAIPLAIYTGQQTLLFRHPAPPEGFAPLAGAQPAAQVFQGRYPAVTANTSQNIGGTVTATLMADGKRADRSASEMAAVALHEAFHVDQRARHKTWQGNEGVLLLYPSEDAQLLTWRRLEADALRRALAATDPQDAACWAKQALIHRRQRFAAMDSTFVAYERATELNEGLAAYIQEIAAGHTTIAIPAAEYAPAEVRQRAYTVGPALAFLLDRMAPGWQARLDAHDQLQLDGILAEAVGNVGPGMSAVHPTSRVTGVTCALSPTEQAALERTARADAAAVVAGRAQRRRWFDALAGWRLEVQAANGLPLWPQGFDPLNVERVDGGLLHTRWCSLANDSGKLEALDGDGADLVSFTEGAGAHPLFNGVRRVVVAGLSQPQVQEHDGSVSVRAPGLIADFPHATVREQGTQVLVQLTPTAPPKR